jgi:molecular chaperone Hsp33
VPLGKEELLKIIEEEGKVSVHCHYCNTDYTFERADIEKLFKK